MTYDWLYRMIHDQWIGIISLVVASTTLRWRIQHGKRWAKVEEEKKMEEDRKQASEDKEWVEQLRLSLEHAYDSIAVISEEGDIPMDDRVSWLTAARHISRYWDMKRNLKTGIFTTLCNEHEEYWRHRFYLLLNKMKNGRFFGTKHMIDEGHSEIVEPRSAAIVFAFAQWKNDDKDPTDDHSLEDLIVDYDLFSYKCRVFRDFIKRERPLVADKVKEIQSGRGPQ